MSPVTSFSITLHHLAEDLSQVGTEFGDVERNGVTAAELRRMIQTFAALAPRVMFPVESEMRIGGPHGRFLVQARNGQVKVISWSTQGVGTDMTPDRIFAMIVGMEEGEAIEPVPTGWLTGLTMLGRRTKIWLLAAVIIGSNAITAWMLTRGPARPPLQLLPAYRTIAPEQAQRVIAEFAGNYETGRAAGDRRLQIAPDGTLHWALLGNDLKPGAVETLTATAAESKGRPVLVASNFGMIELKDPITLVYFGDTYRRTKAP